MIKPDKKYIGTRARKGDIALLEIATSYTTADMRRHMSTRYIYTIVTAVTRAGLAQKLKDGKGAIYDLSGTIARPRLWLIKDKARGARIWAELAGKKWHTAESAMHDARALCADMPADA